MLFAPGGSEGVEIALKLARVATGLGKTGSLFSHEPFGAQPDILVLGKALGGAMLPLAAVIARPGLDVAADRAEAAFYAALTAGVSLKISQRTVLTLSPPLIIDRVDLERALSIVARAIASA